VSERNDSPALVMAIDSVDSEGQLHLVSAAKSTGLCLFRFAIPPGSPFLWDEAKRRI
jgi:hypothetical protein